MRRIPRGTRVEVCQCSGLDSGIRGTIINRSEVKLNGRGMPLIPGHYRPVNWRKAEAIRTDKGNIITMFRDRLIVLKGSR